MKNGQEEKKKRREKAKNNIDLKTSHQIVEYAYTWQLFVLN